MKTSSTARSLSLVLAAAIALLPAPAAFAATPMKTGNIDPLQVQGPQQTAEFLFRNSPRDNLITVQVFGSVARPGIYYVPEDTDLMRLLTLAGGVVNSSELDEVVVHKLDAKVWKGLDDRFVEQRNPTTFAVNVDKMLKDTAVLRPLKMNHDDFVYVPQKEPWISNDAAKAITLGGVLLTGVLTFFLIKKNDK
jgi:competence protein ComEA